MPTKKVLFLVLVIFTLGIACSLPAYLTSVQVPQVPLTQAPTQLHLVTAPPDATATPTPFQPGPAEPGLDPPALTGTPDPNGPVWGDYPGPSVSPSIAIPPPVDLFPQPPGQVNVLLLGSDQRPNEGGFRTDTILLLTVNPTEGSVSLTSFPRDLYVYIPGWTMQRINTAMAHGDFPTLQQTFAYNFGVSPDAYVMINFWGLTGIIDNLQGIYVDVARPHSDHRNRYGTYTVPAGRVFMDGATALWYARSRYSTNDFDRTRRQQEVLLGLFYRLLSLDAVQNAPALFDLYRQSVVMNLTFQDVSPFLPLATQIGDTGNIQRYRISSENITPWRTPGGAAVLLPIREDVLEIMRQALNVP